MPIVKNGLIGYWNSKQGVSGNVWENIAPDTIGSHNGTINGATVTEDGMLFDGIDDDIKINIPPQFMQPTSFTLDFIFNQKSYQANFFSNNTNYTLDFDSGISWVCFRTIDDVKGELYFNHSMGLNTDYHVVCTYSAIDGTTQFYVNGQLTDSDTFSRTDLLLAWDGILTIGSVYNQSWEIDGILDSVKIYNRVLTQTEIQQNYLMGKEVGLEEDEEEPVPTKTPIGIHKLQTANGIIDLPVYEIIDVQDALYRVQIDGKVGCFELVEVFDVKASPLRVMTKNGVKSIAKA